MKPVIKKMDDSRKVEKAMKKRLPPDIDLDNGVEHLIYMNYVMFLERLAEETNKVARANNKKRITVNDIMEVAEDVMQEFRG